MARDLGVSQWSPGGWVEPAVTGQALGEPTTRSVGTTETRKIRRRRQELEDVSCERDILKCLGILSAEPK